MSFTIDEIYKKGVPRGQFYRSDLHSLNTTTSVALTISPSTSPAWAVLTDKVTFKESSFATGGTGSGVLKIEYPNYDGLSVNTYTFSSLTALKHAADEVIEHNSETYYVWKPQPPILVKGSNAENSITIGLPTDVTVSAGDLDFLVSGWTLKETDFD